MFFLDAINYKTQVLDFICNLCLKLHAIIYLKFVQSIMECIILFYKNYGKAPGFPILFDGNGPCFETLFGTPPLLLVLCSAFRTTFASFPPV